MKPFKFVFSCLFVADMIYHTLRASAHIEIDGTCADNTGWECYGYVGYFVQKWSSSHECFFGNLFMWTIDGHFIDIRVSVYQAHVWIKIIIRNESWPFATSCALRCTLAISSLKWSERRKEEGTFFNFPQNQNGTQSTISRSKLKLKRPGLPSSHWKLMTVKIKVGRIRFSAEKAFAGAFSAYFYHCILLFRFFFGRVVAARE